jgi:hypothetical protein
VLVNPEVDGYLRRLTSQVDAVFGDRLTGAWLLGSGAYGGFNEDSDLDVQAATETEPAADDLDQLTSLIVPDLPACPAAGLEFVLYHRAVLAALAPPLRWSLNINGGPRREQKVSVDPSSESWHWFVLDLAVGRQLAVTLQGSDLGDVVAPIDRDLTLAAIEASVRWHDQHEPDGANRLANAARGLRYIETGEWCSKPAARTWLANTGHTDRQALDELRFRLHID